jgi:hypothetical protein
MRPTARFLTEQHLLRAIDEAEEEHEPYRHWLLENMLPASVLAELNSLPCTPATTADTGGRRETHNSTRTFFGPSLQAEDWAADALAFAFQDPAMVDTLERRCGVDLSGSYLRIEFCQDVTGFWLEPHTDIGAKLFTMLIYLNDPPIDEYWGTDLLYPDGRLAGRAPSRSGAGLIFIPSDKSWHGFEPRQITGVRRTLIVNYVIPDWRSRHELAFPDQPIPGR